MAIPQTPLKLEGTAPQTEDSPVKRLQEKLTLKIQNLGNRVKETEKVLETGGTMLRLKPGESAADIERLKKQVAHAEQLKQVMNQIHAAKDLDQIFVELREGILGLLDAERITLYGVDYDKKEIYSKFLDPDTLKDIKEIRVPVNEQSIAGFVAKNTKTVNIADAYNKGELTEISPVLSFDSSWDQKTGFRTKQILTVPPFSSDNLLTGVMQLVNRKSGDRFTKEDEEQVQEIATTLGIAFYNQYQLARKKPTRFDYLISSGLITQAELDATIKEAREKQKEIESLLMEKYKTPRKEIGKSLSLFYKCPFLEFDERVFIPPDLVKNISLNYLKANYWIPLRRSEDSVDVLIDDPYSFQKLQDVKRLFPVKEVKFFVALRDDILKFVSSVATDLDPNVPKQSIAAILGELTTEDQAKPEEAAAGVIDENDSAVVRLANQIVIDAYKEGASDIHIEPQENRSLVRLRIDGILTDVLSIPKYLHDRITTRIKVLSSLRTDEHLSAQDGKMRAKLEEENLDIRVSIVPVVDGEKAVLRLLSSRSREYTFASLGMNEADLKKVSNAYTKSYGMVLSTGPTGSGKTTSIYSILKILNTREKNITTVEDPVEYRIAGANQIQVNVKTNLTFANGLRSILRQDPNIIFVGEIRDSETAAIAVNAALTGHLVLSTLHTNDAATAIPRLSDMKVEPYLVASTVSVIVAQRLVRQVCQQCKIPVEVSYAEMTKNFPADVVKKSFGTNAKTTIYQGQGCKLCHQSGYSGRIGVFEVLEVNKNIRKLIIQKSDSDVILKAAVAEGMKTMLEDGLEKVARGETTIEEILRVTKSEFLS